MATVDLGKISFVNKGTYAAGTTYEERDVVQFTDGALSSYVYINGTPAAGQTPSSGGTVNSSHWSLFAGGVSIGVGNNKIVTTDGSGNVSSVALGSATQIMQVNAGGTALEFAAKPSGGIRQVKQFTANSEFTTASNTYVNTNLITATFDSAILSGSKVLVQLECICSEQYHGSWAGHMRITVFDGSTNIGNGNLDNAFRTLHASTAGNDSGATPYMAMQFYGSVLHTPSGTSPSYTIHLKSHSTSMNRTIGSANNASADYNSGGTRLTIYEVTV